jgi:hypothetical protein
VHSISTAKKESLHYNGCTVHCMSHVLFLTIFSWIASEQEVNVWSERDHMTSLQHHQSQMARWKRFGLSDKPILGILRSLGQVHCAQSPSNSHSKRCGIELGWHQIASWVVYYIQTWERSATSNNSTTLLKYSILYRYHSHTETTAGCVKPVKRIQGRVIENSQRTHNVGTVWCL